MIILYYFLDVLIIAMWILSATSICMLYKRGELPGGIASVVVGLIAIAVSLFFMLWFIERRKNAKASKKF
jgi:small-conductance mechanosensitive channel